MVPGYGTATWTLAYFCHIHHGTLTDNIAWAVYGGSHCTHIGDKSACNTQGTSSSKQNGTKCTKWPCYYKKLFIMISWSRELG